MPKHLPDAPAETRALSERDDGDGYDTEVASFFGAAVPERVPKRDDEVDTLVESADLGQSARDRARRRTRVKPATMTR